MTVISLVKSAFGRKATLYTPLNCTKTSSESDLRSAYKKAALRFHPDKANANNSRDNNFDGDTTLKFQAVSAAYQVLMDEKQRAAYDATGQVLDEHDYDTGDEGNQQQVPRRKGKRPRNQKQQQWEDFFHSVFNEIISTGSQYENDAKMYSGSVQEHHDVLKYYNMCRGNMQKVLECVVHATQEDLSRWRKDIIDPAIYRGEVDDFLNNVNATTTKVLPKDVKKNHFTTPTSEDDTISTVKRSSSKLKRPKRGRDIFKKKSSCLVDTDDEFEQCNVVANKLPRQKNKAKTNSTTMSMREKMDYRVAKKRKIKAAKEMEIAKIVQSKTWDGGSNNHVYGNQERNKNRGGVSDQLLSQIERKYAAKSKSGRRNI